MVARLQEKYEQERIKRVNVKGLGQYLEESKGSLFALDVDPWVESGADVHEPVPDGGHCKILIFGAGLGGLCAAIRCLESGAATQPDDILLVDAAGGFGGTWWWNRFPGLMCDVESYVYLPFLEETGYMPKRKYASGEEIRGYSDLLADKYGLRQRALFQSIGKSLTWSADRWVCKLAKRAKGLPEMAINVTANFVILASGNFTYPKLPALPNVESFKGKMIHTARWDYATTGGSASNPTLTGLSGKKVAVVGTGATAIQVVPEVAKYAGELYVFQRTASAVDVRNNTNTDPQEWRTKIANKKGWQAARAENFQAFTENEAGGYEEDLVNDGMSTMPTISGAWGGNSSVPAEELSNFIKYMTELDAQRSDRVRQRAMDIVNDPETAKKLQAWYPGWCKRPTFHDDYLPSFNLPNVTLIDTEGRGISDLSATGIIANGTDYPIDIIIWGTGYGSPLIDSLAGKVGMRVTGRDGSDMDQVFKQGDLLTLHGIFHHAFPNIFSLGLSQAGVGVNQVQRLDAMSQHVGYTITAAEKKSGSKNVVIEPSKMACDQWGDRVASYAYLLANMAGCLPSYFNAEGDMQRAPPEAQAKSLRNTLWGQGFNRYAKILKDWERSGDLEGLEVTGA